MTTVVGGAFLLYSVLGHVGNKAVSDILSAVVALLGTIWSLWGIREAKTKSDRRGLVSSVLLSLGVAGYFFGGTVYAYYDLVLHQTPFPSWADAGYLSGTLFTVVAVVLLPSRPLPVVMRLRVLMDSLMVMAAFVTFSWYFALGPIVLDGEATLLGKILGGAYPLMDLSMLFCALMLALDGSNAELRRARALVVAGILGYVMSDSVYGYLTLQNTYEAGGPIDVGWMLSNLLFAQAAVALRNLKFRNSDAGSLEASSEIAARSTSFWRALLPYTFVPAVLALLVYVHHREAGGGLEAGVNIGAGTLLLLIMVRQVLAIAENARLYRFLQAAYRELEGFATVDTMTGLANHRVFQQRLRGEIARGEETGDPTSLLLIDVDRFKQYNDSYGHPAGDEALRIVARVLRESVRETDLPARYGGEEFAVILPGTSTEAAEVIAERIRSACESTAFPHRPVTMSIGVVTDRGREADDMIEAADHALYAAKHGGRNQVVVEGVRLKVSDRAELPSDRLPEGWSLEESRALGLNRVDSTSEVMNGPIGPVVRALLAMLDLRDHDVERHSDRVMRYCLRLAKESTDRGLINFTAEQMSDLYLGALLHDIGKVGVPDAILRKPGALNADEWQIIRRHPIQGAEILADFPPLAGAVPVVRSHHERWDGGGYPDGLAGESIPLGARLFALADTLDAMGSDRPYRKARPYSEIRAEVLRMAGRQFDPALVEAFLAVPADEWERMRTDVALPKAA